VEWKDKRSKMGKTGKQGVKNGKVQQTTIGEKEKRGKYM